MMQFKELNVGNCAEEEMKKKILFQICADWKWNGIKFLYALWKTVYPLCIMWQDEWEKLLSQWKLIQSGKKKKCKFHYSYIMYKFSNQKAALVSLYDSLVLTDSHRCSTCIQPFHRKVCSYSQQPSQKY